MPRRPRTTAAAILFAAVLVHSAPARADVVPGPTPVCPPNKELIVSHGGAYCGEKAPTTCPPGWRGEPGDRCVVATCAADADCERMGLGACVDATLCRHKLKRLERGAERETESTIGIAGAGAPCQAPRYESAGKVCAKRGEAPTAFVPAPGTPSNGPPHAAPPADPGGPRKAGSSCACALGAEGDAGPVAVVAGLLLLAWARRRDGRGVTLKAPFAARPRP